MISGGEPLPPDLREIFLDPLRALRGGSFTAASSSDGNVNSTKLKKYSSTSGYRCTLACQSSSIPRFRVACAAAMSLGCGGDW